MKRPRSKHVRKMQAAHDKAWHDARMAEGVLGTDGRFVPWELNQYSACVRMADDKTMGGKAPDHRAIAAKAWRLYRKLKPTHERR